jgi:hypothetical protein
MTLKEQPAIIKYIKRSANFFTQTIKAQWLFFVILAVGILARIWDFGNTPPGLNPDEASIGVEAYYLFKYGIDRNGISYPVHLIAWGSGQNVLYAYILMPMFVFKGLTISTVRFPMMVTGILSLPLMYYAGKRVLGEKYALAAMFFMAISPFHIVNTRWAVESNILPFMFLAGFVFFLAASRKGIWFIPAVTCFALCLYAYGTAYVAIPVFLVMSIPLVVYYKKIDIKYIIPGLLLFFLLATPIILFVVINTFKLETLHIGSVTIPRLPVEARYESLAAIFENNPLQATANNIGIMLNLLWSQEDDFVWNFVKQFGYFYKVTFPLAVIGFFSLIYSLKNAKEARFEKWLLLSWLVSTLFIGVIHPVNLTRINLIFTPILFCILICLIELNKRVKYVMPISLVALAIGFIFFNLAYHGSDYQQKASNAFNAGIIEAIKYAGENSNSMICVSEQTRFAYIYVLFEEKYHPSEYLGGIEWLLPPEHPLDPARSPRQLGMFHFRNSDCANDPSSVYILKLKELLPNQDIKYKIKRFTKYTVYVPKGTP